MLGHWVVRACHSRIEKAMPRGLVISGQRVPKTIDLVETCPLPTSGSWLEIEKQRALATFDRSFAWEIAVVGRA